MELIDLLGAIVVRGQTIHELAQADPAVLPGWARSKGQSHSSRAQQLYAKTLLSLIETVHFTGFTGPVVAAPPPVAAAPPAAAPFAGPPAALARRRGMVVYPGPPTIAATGDLTFSDLFVQVVATAKRLWQFAPWVVTIACLIVLLQILSHPEAVLVFPLRVLSGLQWYCTFAVDRLVQRLELEAYRTLFGHAPSIQPASSAEASSVVPFSSPAVAYQGAPSYGLWGWILAAVAFFRK